MTQSFGRNSWFQILIMLFLAPMVHGAQVNWSSDVENSLRAANSSHRDVLLKFTADWCGYCKKMERTTFTDPEIVTFVHDNFVPVLVDADQHRNLMRDLSIKGLPAILIVSPDMKIVARITGYQTAAKLLPKLQSAAAQNQVVQSRPVVGRPVSVPGASQSFAVSKTLETPQTRQLPSATSGTLPEAADNPIGRTNGNSGTITTSGFTQSAAAAPAFDGFCLPSVIEQRKLIAGDATNSIQYKGRTLRFQSGQQMQKFVSNPNQYWPALDGYCPMTKLQTGQNVVGQLEFAAVFRDKVWLFVSEEQMQAFIAEPAKHVGLLGSVL